MSLDRDCPLRVEKYVSPDNGTTWYDADSQPGPYITSDIMPQFKIVVSNFGFEPLVDVILTDSTLGINISIGMLCKGSPYELIVTGTWTAGQQSNTANVCGKGKFGIQFTDSDTAYYFGADPSIEIVKYVSVDGGATWDDSNTPPGPLLPAGATPQFKFTVTNTGNVTLSDITVTDSVFGIIGTLVSLAPGASTDFYKS